MQSKKHLTEYFIFNSFFYSRLAEKFSFFAYNYPQRLLVSLLVLASFFTPLQCVTMAKTEGVYKGEQAVIEIDKDKTEIAQTLEESCESGVKDVVFNALNKCRKAVVTLTEELKSCQTTVESTRKYRTFFWSSIAIIGALTGISLILARRV